MISPATEFRVNTTTPFNQVMPVTTTLTDGSVIVVWSEMNLRDGGSALKLQHFDAHGNLIGGETSIIDNGSALYSPPSVARLNDGGFVVTWNGGADSDIHMQRFDAAAAPVGGQMQASPEVDIIQRQGSQAVTGLNDGGWLVAWRSEVDAFGYQHVYSQRYDASGSPVGSQPGTVQGENIPIGNISVTSLLSGGWVATWDANGEILQRRYDAGGQVPGDGAPRLVAKSGGDPPHVAALADGGWVVLYPGEYPTLYTQRYDSAGVAVGDATAVSSNAVSTFGIGASVAGLAGGGWVVAWSTTGVSDPIDIHAQRFDAAGAKAGTEIVVNTEKQYGQVDPTVTALQDGGFLVAWSSAMQDGSDAGIYAARFDANGVAQSNIGWLQGDASNDLIQWDGPQPARLSGYGGDDTLAGGPGDDIMDGGTGKDVFLIGSGHDHLNGGAGVDTAVFAMSTAGLTGYSSDTHGSFSVSTTNGTFDLSTIDRAQFSNGLFALDTQAPTSYGLGAGNTWWAASLFHAGFGQLPGLEDLSRWTAQADQLGTPAALGQAMIDAYAPGVSNHDLIAYLYEVHAHTQPTEEQIHAYEREIAPSPPPSGGSAPWFATQGAFLEYVAQMPFNENALAGFTGNVQPLDPGWF